MQIENANQIFGLKAEVDRPITFRRAEQILFALFDLRAQLSSGGRSMPLIERRIANLLERAQRARREAGNDARFDSRHP